MRKKPSFFKTLFGTVIVLIVVYFSVFTLASNEEIVSTEILRDVPYEIEPVIGTEVEPLTSGIDIEIKGTKEMHNKLEKEGPLLTVKLEEVEIEDEDLEPVEAEIVEEEEIEEDTEENIDADLLGDNSGEESKEVEVNLNDKYKTVVRVEGLDEYIYKVLTDVQVNITELEPEEVTLKVKIRGKSDKEIKDITIYDTVYGYFNEQDREEIDDISVYIDLDELNDKDETVGEIRILDEDGNDIGNDGRLDKEEVDVKVIF